MTQQDPPSRFSRSLGLGGALTVGVSAMVGTGVFAVWGPALESAGGWLLASVLIASMVAALNATSTARLASRFPEAGGVYAYGRIQLSRFAGVVAGVVFIIGKTASASAAALTIGLYLWPERSRLVALSAIVLVLLLNLRGIVRSTRVAAVMVSIVGVILMTFVITSGVTLLERPVIIGASLPASGPIGVLAAAGLIFVAFAGYARITVLGEEVTEPRRNIPRAIAGSFVIVSVGYVAIAAVVLLAALDAVVIEPAALLDLAQALGPSWMGPAVVFAAVLAAGSVLLTLIAGVGRTVFAMAARGDAPRMFATVGRRTRIPIRAEVASAAGAGALVAMGGLTLALAISATMILLYYSISHVAAARLRPDSRSDSRSGPRIGNRLLQMTPFAGLAGCLLLVGALFVDRGMGG